MIIANADWSVVMLAFFNFATLVVVAWNKYQANRIEKKVDIVHALGNSNAGIQARTLEVSAKALAVSDPTPENRKLAENASKAVKEHDLVQAKADAIEAPKP